VPANARAQEVSACYVGRKCSAECKASSEAAHQYLEKLTTVGVRHVTACASQLQVTDRRYETGNHVGNIRVPDHAPVA